MVSNTGSPTGFAPRFGAKLNKHLKALRSQVTNLRKEKAQLAEYDQMLKKNNANVDLLISKPDQVSTLPTNKDYVYSFAQARTKAAELTGKALTTKASDSPEIEKLGELIQLAATNPDVAKMVKDNSAQKAQKLRDQQQLKVTTIMNSIQTESFPKLRKVASTEIPEDVRNAFRVWRNISASPTN